jgi:HD superfamily phosphohydrolase YqeK
VLAYAEALRSLDPKRLEHALGVVQAAQEIVGSDPDLAEISTLLAAHPGLPQSDAQ